MASMRPAPFLTMPVIKAAFAVARDAGGEGRLVGGAVRDWLLDRALGDFDMAVTVPITDFIHVARANQYQIYETGLAHGSVLFHHEGCSVEVTQTRADISTDGRHAVISFAPSFDEDARRRDFTINALYLAQDGSLYDPLDAMPDITHRRLRFIGIAEDRLQEDYLRLLRFFRFIAQLPDCQPDEAAMAVMPAHFDGLGQVSAERILQEFKKLFAGANWPEAIRLCQQIGLDKALFGAGFLPALPDVKSLDSWQVVAASLLDEVSAPAFLALPHARRDRAMIERLHMPFTEAEFACLSGDKWREIAHFGGADFYHRCLVQQRYHRTLLSPARLQELRHFTPPPCPVTGRDLQLAGISEGPEIGQLLLQAEQLYLASDYQLDSAAIMAELVRK